MNDKPRKPVTLTGRNNAQRDVETSTQPRLTMAEIGNNPGRAPYAARAPRPTGGRYAERDANREATRGERPARSERPARAERPLRSDRGPQAERPARTSGSRDGASAGRYSRDGGPRKPRQPAPYQNAYDDRDSIARAFSQDSDAAFREPGNREPGNVEPGNHEPGNFEPGNREPGNRDPNYRDRGSNENRGRAPRHPRRSDSRSESRSDSRTEPRADGAARRHSRPQRARSEDAFNAQPVAIDEFGNQSAIATTRPVYEHDEDRLGNTDNSTANVGVDVNAERGNTASDNADAGSNIERSNVAMPGRARHANPRARARRPLENSDEQDLEPGRTGDGETINNETDADGGQRRSRLFRMNKQPAPRRGRHGVERMPANSGDDNNEARNGGLDVEGRPLNAQRSDESRIYGINACRAVFAHRPDAIVRMYVAQNRLSPFTDIMKYCASNRRAYHVVPEEELVAASGSEHHEGICMLIRRREVLGLNEFLAQLPDDQACQLLVLENVGNPHNLGALLRSAAHFGVDAVLLNAGSPLHSGSTARVAEGGVEHVKLVEYSDVEHLIEALKANFINIIATSSHETESIYQFELPKRSAVCFGEEQRGLSKTLLDASDARIIIPGSGAVESLNVSVAAGIVMSEMLRRRQPL